ncbi:nucleoside recognition domain-containing protein [Polluticoccus soli]|uniref:nucleoside recognition domain-containing protein n=1 Tax=Polluticoccus soli TaxID=3034150 RepID=UPI0023E26740|nr:spore maturation protein [Flavipsychrobacter sp. JY13-12]
MALSRIWSGFIIVAILVAGYRCFFAGDDQIFSRMVIGKADEAYETVYYQMVGEPEKAGLRSREDFAAYLAGYGYVPADSAHPPTVLLARHAAADSVVTLSSIYPTAQVYTFRSIQHKLVKKTDGIIETCKSAVNICIGLIGVMALFMGFLSIAERAGGVRLMSRMIWPFFSKIFPEVPKGHPAMGHMMMNFAANLLNLDNAATPFGIKAMESLQELNPNKEKASNAQLMFLCLHAAGMTLIPVSIIAARSAVKSASPTDIFIPCMIATFVATITAMILVAIRQGINLFQTAILAWVGGICALIALLVIYVNSLSADEVQSFSALLSNSLILVIFLLIIFGALYKKVDVFDAFVDGAKGGFETAIRIIPYLVGMLVAISMLRTSGTFDVIINGMKHFFASLGADTRFVDGLPTALIKPLSGSGARGMMVDTMKTFGPDSFAGRLASILQGSSDTTFYVVAVYFGAVAIKNTRYAIGTMLLADLVGILTSIGLCYMFFG